MGYDQFKMNSFGKYNQIQNVMLDNKVSYEVRSRDSDLLPFNRLGSDLLTKQSSIKVGDDFDRRMSISKQGPARSTLQGKRETKRELAGQKPLFARQATIGIAGRFALQSLQKTNRLTSALRSSSAVKSSTYSNAATAGVTSEEDELLRQQAAKEKLEHKRVRQITLAFEKLDQAIQEDVESLQAIEARHEQSLEQNYNTAYSGIQKLQFVRLLKDFEECSEYENTYNQIDEETKAASKQVQDLVAKAFAGVKFQNEGPSLSLDKGGRNDSPEHGPKVSRSPNRFSGGEDFVPDSEIIYNTQFHEMLDERYEEKRRLGGSSNAMAGHIQNAGLFTYRELQCHLMLMMSRRFLTMLYHQLLGETYIVQCCLIEMSDGPQNHSDAKARKKAHKFCHQALVKLVKQIQVDRFMIFLVASYPEQMQQLSQKKRFSDRTATPYDFLYKFATKMLKRLRKFLLSFNYLLIHGNLYMLAELCSTVKAVMTWGCGYFIEKLQAIEQEQRKKLAMDAKKAAERARGAKEPFRRGSRMPSAGRAALHGKGDMTPPDTGAEGAAADSPKRTKSAQTVTFKFGTPDQLAGTAPKPSSARKASALAVADDVVQQTTLETMNVEANTKVINLLKTMYGMADEMDSCDFFNENQMRSDVVFGKVKERDVQGVEGKSDEEEDTAQTQNIVEQVFLLERELDRFDWLKFKGKKKISTLARNTGRRSFSELIGPDGQLTFLQKSHDSEESFGTDSTSSQAEKVAEDMAKAGGADKQPTLRQQTRSSLKRPKPWASRGEEEDDILQGFDDPLKYHPAHAAGHDGTKASTAFRVYQQGDKINRETPSVTFGKGILDEQEKLLRQASGNRRSDAEESKGKEAVRGREPRSLSKTFQGTIFENQFYRYMLAEQYEKHVGPELISERRMRMPLKQVITRDNIQEVMSLQHTNKSFQVILANLLFSANNPFQEDVASIQDLQHQDKLDAKTKNDYGHSGSLSYVFHGKYRQFKALLTSQLNGQGDEEDGYGQAQGRAASDSDLGMASNAELAKYQSQVKREGTPFQVKQIQQNLLDALTQRSRFLDISLIVRQLERKSTKIDQEIERRLEEQQEKSGQGSTVALHAARDKVHDSAGPVLRPGAAYNSNQSASPVQASILDSYPNKFAARSGTRRNLDRDDGPLDGSFGADNYQRGRTGGDPRHRSKNSSLATDDEFRGQETQRSRKAVKRKMEQRVVSLLQMDDFRFYRPSARGTRDSGSHWGDAARKGRKELSAPVFDASAEDFEEEQALFLLAKLRKEEMELQRGYFDSQARTAEEEFESAHGSGAGRNSRGSRALLMEDEDEALREQHRQMEQFYRKQLSYRDHMVQRMVDRYKEGNASDGEEEDEYLLMDPDAPEEKAGMGGKNDSGIGSMRPQRFVSLLDFPVNEMNPYRDPARALAAQLNESSVAMQPSGSTHALSQGRYGSQGKHSDRGSGGQSHGHLSCGPPTTLGERTATLGGGSSGQERRGTLTGLQTRRGTVTDSKRKATTGSGPASRDSGEVGSMASFGRGFGTGAGPSAAQKRFLEQQLMQQRHQQFQAQPLQQQSMEELTKIKEVLSPAAGAAGDGAEAEARAATEPDLPRAPGDDQPFSGRADKRYARFLGHQQADDEGNTEAAAQRQHPLLGGAHDSLEGLADQFQELQHGFGGEDPSLHDQHVQQIDEVFANFLSSGSAVPKMAQGQPTAFQPGLNGHNGQPNESDEQDSEERLYSAIQAEVLRAGRKRVSTEIVR